MTIDKSQNHVTPFLLSFAEPIERTEEPVAIRYDPESQISQFWSGRCWTDALDSNGMLGATRKTGVGQETTDDD